MPIIQNLSDNDLYKYTMQQAVLHNFPSAQGEFQFINRSGVDLMPYKDEIKKEIENLCSLKFTTEELDFLSTLPYMKPDYIDFLEDFTLKEKGMKLYEKDKKLHLSYKGSWVQKILFEVPLMAIISEVYLRDKTNYDEYQEIGFRKLKENAQLIKDNLKLKIKFADFGTRRRFSKAWQTIAVNFYKEELPGNFVGTSNLYLAMKLGLTPIGTMAHEWLQAGQALGKVQLKYSQKYMLETWVKEYRGELGIALTDTINTKAFLRDFDKYFAKLFDGGRHDSGCPEMWVKDLINHYKNLRIDPLTKTAVFSDGLDFPKVVDIAEFCQGKIQSSFGIGTKLTNDVGVTPLSMVIKLVGINGNPVAKISDEPEKAICNDQDFLSYLKKVYRV